MKMALIFSFLFGLATSISQASYQVTEQDLSELKGFCKALTVSYSPEELKKVGISSGISYAEEYTFVATSGVEFQFKIQDFNPLQSSGDFWVDTMNYLTYILGTKYPKITESYKSYYVEGFKNLIYIRRVFGEVRPHLLEKYSHPFFIALTNPDLRPQINENYKLHVQSVDHSVNFVMGLVDEENLSNFPLVTRFLEANPTSEVYGLFARYKNPYHPKFGQEILLLKFKPEKDM